MCWLQRFAGSIGTNVCGYGGMADALGSSPSGGNPVEVRLLLAAPKSCPNGEMAATHGLGPCARKGVGVRLPLWAPEFELPNPLVCNARVDGSNDGSYGSGRFCSKR